MRLRRRRSWRCGALLLAAVTVGCNGGDVPEDWTSVRRGDLILGVDVTGTLKAVDSDLLGPPQLGDKWDFKIARMADEGDKVEKGDMVLAFDFTDLRQELERKENEADATRTELEKRKADYAMARRDEELAIAEAEGGLRKAKLKVDRPDDLVAMLEIKEAELDLELAEKTLEYQKERAAASRRQAQAEMSYLQDQLERADGRVGEIRMSMAQMMVRAPRSGTVIYVTDWRGEKKKVGDSIWRAQQVLEIVSLEKMMAEGDVDEVDASKIAVGQRVSLRLDAHPDREFTGTLKSIVKSVQPQSYRIPLKVVRVEVDLDQVDKERMRPGMRYRGTIETGRVEDLLLISVDALFVGDEGPVVYRRDGDDFETVRVELGRRNKEYVEVLSGLSEGDTVSRADLSSGAR